MNRLPSIVRQHLAALRMLLVFTVICGIIYPVVMWGVAQAAFRDQADGSLVTYNGKVVGSSLLCQEFVDAKGNPLPTARSRPRPRARWPRLVTAGSRSRPRERRPHPQEARSCRQPRARRADPLAPRTCQLVRQPAAPRPAAHSQAPPKPSTRCQRPRPQSPRPSLPPLPVG